MYDRNLRVLLISIFLLEMSAIPNYDFWTADRDVMADIFGSSYNYGYSVASDLTYETPKKCQITEIIDDDFEGSQSSIYYGGKMGRRYDCTTVWWSNFFLIDWE